MRNAVAISILVLSFTVRVQVSVAIGDSMQNGLRDRPISDDSTHIVVYEAYDVTTKAYFPGGDTGLVRYLIHNYKFTEGDEEYQYKRVYLSFVINQNSHVSDIKLLRSSIGHETHEQEAIRFIESTSGMWVPATRNGKKGKCDLSCGYSV